MRRSLLLVLTIAFVAMVMMASSSAPVAETQPAGTSAIPSVSAAGHQGDVNCDGAANAVDSLEVLGSTAGLPSTAGCLQVAGDVDCSGVINSIDALKILRFTAGLSAQTPSGCAPIGDLLGPPSTSETLIAAALAAGDITYEESLLYRAYALFDDPRLPAGYRSPVVNLHAAIDLFGEVDQSESQLSPALLAQLAPFRARPADPISIFNNPPNAAAAAASAAPAWTSKPAGAGARVWVKASDGADAQLTQHAADVGKVWDKMPGIFTYPEADQAGDPTIDVNPDGAIDFYFVDASDLDPRRAFCVSHPEEPACRFGTANYGFAQRASPVVGHTSSSYLVIDGTIHGDQLLDTLAHELTHAGQFAYDNNESSWLMESTATWAAYRVIKKLGLTPSYAYGYTSTFFAELNQTLTHQQDKFSSYAAWPFFLFASMEKGDGIVTSIWQTAAADGVQGIAAVNTNLSLDSYFDDFSVRNWNQDPVPQQYKTADPTFPTDKPTPVLPTYFGGPDEAQIEDSFEPLSARYYSYKFGASVHTVVFHNKLKGTPHAHIWGMAKINGEWQAPEDWTGDEKQSWCLDVPSQELDELILIVSNSDISNTLSPPERPSVEAKASGCTNWRGTIRWTVEETTGSAHLSITSVAEVYFKNAAPQPGISTCDDGLGNKQACETYFASGTVTYNSTDVVTYEGGCTTTIGPAIGTIAQGEGLLKVYTTPDPPTYEGTGLTFVTGQGTDVCPGSGPQSFPYHDGDIWFRAPAGMFHLKDHGALIEDTFTWGHMVYEWHLEPAE